MQTRNTALEVKRLVKFVGEGPLKAFCDLAIGDLFLIKGLRVVKGKHGFFVGMPRQQGKDHKWYDLVIALSDDSKREMGRVVLGAYQQECPDETTG